MPIEISTLGPLRIQVDGVAVPFPGAQRNRVLAWLCLADGALVSSDRLVDLVWEGEANDASAQTLRSHIRAIRSMHKDSDFIRTARGRGYALDGNLVSFPEQTFQSLVAKAREGIRDGEVVEAHGYLAAALDLWHGAEPYPELADSPSAVAHRSELIVARSWAQRAMAGALLEMGESAEALGLLEALHADDPLDQAVAAQLMRALASCGQPDAASAVYDQLCRTLRQANGSLPLSELVDLDASIVQQDPGVARLPPSKSREKRERASTAELARRPAPLTPLVGRQTEQATLRSVLVTGRLATIAGPPGIGKTRLAQEIASTWEDPVYWIQLASVSAGDRPSVVGPLRSLVEGLRTGAIPPSMLVVVDNVEHVLGDVVTPLIELLELDFGIRAIVTSREPLHVPGEKVVRLGPLAGGKESSQSDGATELFLSRMSWQPSRREVPVIESICELVDRVPLAIELIASSADRNLEELEEQLSISALPDGRVRAPSLRHQQIREALDWSIGQLPDTDVAVLHATAVWSGPFTSGQAAELLDQPAGVVVRVLRDLVDRSLLVSGAAVDEYAMLNPVRTRIAELVDLSQLRARHADVVLETFRAANPERERLSQFGELEAAFRVLIEQDRAADGVELMEHAFASPYRVGELASVGSLLDRLSLGDDDVRTAALSLRAAIAFYNGDFRAMDQLTSQVIDTVRALGDSRREGRLAILAAAAKTFAGSYLEVPGMLDRADEILEEVSDVWMSAWRWSVGALYLRRVDEDQPALVAAERALQLFDEIGDRHGAIFPRLTIARIHAKRGNVAAALTWAEAAIREGEAIDDWFFTGLGHVYSGHISLALDDLDRASNHFARALHRLRRVPNRITMANTLEQAALIGHAKGKVDEALQVEGFSLAFRDLAPGDFRPRTIETLESVRGPLEAELVQRCLDRGSSLTLAQATDLAQRCLADHSS